jgi:hypothetical protein
VIYSTRLEWRNKESPLSYRGQDLLLQLLDKNSETYNAVFKTVHNFGTFDKQSVFQEETLEKLCSRQGMRSKNTSSCRTFGYPRKRCC